MNNNKIFIGVAWPYVNGDIHVGHLAGYMIPCDIFARFSRLKGYDTLMVSGTDCHGTPITIAADKKGVTPQEIIQEYDPKVRELIKLYNVSYDLFTSTTTENHKNVTQEVFLNLLQNGYIIKKRSEQYYSADENKFLPDRYVEGECSYCHAQEQRGDQCESCGRSLEVGELLNPYSKLSKSAVTLKETEHYFIDYEKLQNEILHFVESSEGWRTWVKNETVGFIKEGLRERAITRDIDWGVAVPHDRISADQQLENGETKRFYVWFDAVIGYLSAAIEWANQKPEERDWKAFWINPNSKHYYFLGKDNLTFHTIFWPGQIIGQKKGYNLPYFPAVNQFLNLEGKKFSKSRGVIIDSVSVGKYFGTDTVRFYIASIMPESKDANWKWSEFKDTVNSELNGNIGNFINRTLVFYKNKLNSTIHNENIQLDKAIIEESKTAFHEITTHLEKCEFVQALNRILKFSKFGNQYFDYQKPWMSIKEDPSQCEQTIYNCLQIVYSLATMLKPFMPDASERLEMLLGIKGSNGIIGEDHYCFGQLDLNALRIANEITPLFKRIEDIDIDTYRSVSQ